MAAVVWHIFAVWAKDSTSTGRRALGAAIMKEMPSVHHSLLCWVVNWTVDSRICAVQRATVVDIARGNLGNLVSLQEKVGKCRNDTARVQLLYMHIQILLALQSGPLRT